MPTLTSGLHLLVVLALVVSTQGALLVRAAFQVRQEWIAETLCVNRHHPERACNGTCYLMRKMEEHDHHEQEGGRDAVLAAPVGVALLIGETTVPPDRWREAPPPAPSDVRAPEGPAPDGLFRPPRQG